MGRYPELADVVFYPDEPSSLSRVHATIQLETSALHAELEACCGVDTKETAPVHVVHHT